MLIRIIFHFYLFSFFTFILIHSSPVLQYQFKRSDFYESFSEPKICFELFNNYPSAAPFLTVKSRLYLHNTKKIPSFEGYNESYALKKKNSSCNTSLIFNLDKKYLDEMQINIDISTYDSDSMLAVISYIFNKEFEAGYFKLFSDNNHFALSSYILDEGKHELSPGVNLADAESYINSLSVKYNDICIVSHNNDGLFLRVKYGMSVIPNGHISHISALYVKDGNILTKLNYTSFVCNSDKPNHNKFVVIIDDEHSRAELYFYAYLQTGTFSERKVKKIPFILENVQRRNINKMKYIRHYLEKFFIIKSNDDIKFRSDGTYYYVYKLKNNKIFYAIEMEYIQISSTVKKLQSIPLSLKTFDRLE